MRDPIDSSGDVSFTVIEIAGEILSFAIPSNWEVWRPPSDLLFLASAPEEVEPFEPQLVVSKEQVAPDTDARGYLVCSFVGLKYHLRAFAEQESGVFQTNGIEVAWLQYTSEVEDASVTQRDFYVVLGDLAYLINCKAPSEQFERWKASFAAIGESISLASGNTPLGR